MTDDQMLAADSGEGTAADTAAAEQTAGADESAEAPAASRADHVKMLEEEGDIAADYLEELMDIADVDGDIDIDVDGDRASVEIRGSRELDRLNAPDGDLMDALQELARLAVQAKTGNRSRLMLDIGGFRAQQRTELEQLADDAIDEAKKNGKAALRPMNPFERKIVHDRVRDAGLRSESEGEGRDRHVVIIVED